MGAVEGLALDESLLLAEDDDGKSYLLPAAATLLRRLQYSKLRVVVCYQEDIPSEKAILLKKMISKYCLECMLWKASCMDDDSFNRLVLTCSSSGGVCLYATSKRNNNLFLELHNNGWKIIVKGTDIILSDNKDVLFIDKLEELLFIICRFNKMGDHNASNATIGYIMKPSREEDFSKRGSFPMRLTQNGLIFVPLTFELPLSWQMQEVDAVLHKATDEIMRIDLHKDLDLPKNITYSEGMQQLERYMENHHECCIIDPLMNIYPLLDRSRIQEILLGLKSICKKNGPRIRAPRFLKVNSFHEANLKDSLCEAELFFPNIVKPKVACGVSDAHNMALVFEMEHFMDLHVPLPAIIQEYVDHDSVLYKFYVLGQKVFYAVKKSMPNADALKLSSEKIGYCAITFDSLKSLPTDNGDLTCKGRLEGSQQPLDVALVTDAANWLRGKLDLTIFGFDVVIQKDIGDHVIVDVNYLPSFKEIPDSDAIPAFWDAIRCSYDSRKRKHLVLT